MSLNEPSQHSPREQSPIVIVLIFIVLIFVLIYLYRQTQWYTEEEEPKEIEQIYTQVS